MKYCLKLLAGFLVLLTTSLSAAQNVINPKTDTIKWEYNQVENKTRNEILILNGHFISYGNAGFLWAQNNTDRKYSFEVKSVTGDWSDINNHGELVYEAVCDEIKGTIRLSRGTNGLTIQLDFAVPDKLTPNIILQINTYSKI